jgi:hypothetical protein
MSENETELQDTEVTETETNTATEENSSETEVGEVVGETDGEPEIIENEVTFKFRIPKGKEEKDRRTPVTLKLPFLTFTGLVEVLNKGDDKIIGYVMDIVNDVIKEAASEQVNDADKPVSKQEDLDESKLSLEYLANVVKERKSSGISKEDWADFKKDYCETMPILTGKEPEKVERAAAIFVNRFQSVKTSKKIIETLKPMLDTWMGAKTEDEQKRWEPIYMFLDKKAEEFLAVSDEDMLKNLV